MSITPMTLASICSCSGYPFRRTNASLQFDDKALIPRPAELRDQPRVLSRITSNVSPNVTTSLPTTVRPRFTRLRSRPDTSFGVEERCTNEQLQSMLLGRLPSEVRQMIYKYVLGKEGWDNRNLNLDTVHNTCVVRQCRHQGSHMEGHKHICKKCRDLGGKDVKKITLQGSLHFSALLRTCRKAYNEAVEILYNHNTFFFHNAADVTLFLRSLPEARRASIRSIHLFSYIPTPIEEVSHRLCSFHIPDIYTWRVACSSLARLSGLKELQVYMGMIHAKSSPVHWSPKNEFNPAALRVLEVLKMIDGPEIFHVKIKSAYGEDIHQLVGRTPYEFEIL